MQDLNDNWHCIKCGGFVSAHIAGKKWLVYDCGNCGHEGRVWAGYGPRKWKCDDCAHCHKIGETWVPYGDTMVKYTDEYACSEGYDVGTGDCPDDAFEPDELWSVACMARS